MCNRHQSIFVSPAAWGLEEGVVRGPRLEFRKLGNGESCTYFAIMWAEKQATHSSLQILLPSCTFLFWEKTPCFLVTRHGQEKSKMCMEWLQQLGLS